MKYWYDYFTSEEMHEVMRLMDTHSVVRRMVDILNEYHEERLVKSNMAVSTPETWSYSSANWKDTEEMLRAAQRKIDNSL